MKRFTNILFVAESSVDNSAAFDQAVTLAGNNQASLTLIDVVHAIPDELRLAVTVLTPQELLNIAIGEKHDTLQQLINSVNNPDIEMDAKVLIGKPFMEIIREVIRHQRDLVIKSVAKPEGVAERLFGGTDLKLLRKCPCPVWLIKSTQQHGYREIVAALDYEPENPENEPMNQQIMELASSVALANFSELHIVHAWRLEHEGFLRSARVGNTSAEVDAMIQAEEDYRRRWLTSVMEKYSAAEGEEAINYLKPQLHLVQGEAGSIVPACADQLGAELVVVGTVGRTGIPGFITGNTAESILQQIDCSVLAVKPHGFVSPVTLEE